MSQKIDIRRRKATEETPIPENLDFAGIEGITIEARQKLARFRPATLGQASRIAGVSPADRVPLALRLSLLLLLAITPRPWLPMA